MTKFKTLLIAFIVTAFISSCGDSNTAKTETTSITSETQKPIEYPFALVDTKKEDRKNDNSYNEMLLFTCGEKPNLDTLQMFCADKKKEFTDGVFHIVVFFDKKENAKFPNNPVTAGYMDEKPAKHIKALYTFNRVNGYSKLDYYDKNSWESTAKTIEIN